MAGCAVFNPDGPFVRGVIDYVDCQSLALAQQGYRALGAGTNFAVALELLIIILVALFGYRMMLGGPITLRSAVSVMLRIGIVLALALQWSAYQPLVYNVATQGPQELLGAIAGNDDTGAQDAAALVNRVQGVDTVLVGILHVEAEPSAGAVTGIARTATNRRTATAATFGQTPELAPETRELLISAENFTVLGALFGLVSVRIVMALMLALGPVFVAGLLFRSTRGIFVGWLRVLFGASLAAIAVPVAIALSLALLEPQALALSRQFYNGLALGTLPERMWEASVLAGLLVVATLVASFWAAAAIRLPEGIRREFHHLVDRVALPHKETGFAAGAAPAAAANRRSHAQAVADAAFTAQRREIHSIHEMPARRSFAPHDAPAGARATSAENRPIGQAGRAGARRQSSAASRRDMMA